jgi:hypothetical protein
VPNEDPWLCKDCKDGKVFPKTHIVLIYLMETLQCNNQF